MRQERELILDREQPMRGKQEQNQVRPVAAVGQIALDSNGDGVITFTRPLVFARDPYLILTPLTVVTSEPVIVNIVGGSFVTNADGHFTSVTIHGERLRPLPDPLTLLSQLLGFRVTQGSGASGVLVDWAAF